MSTKIAVGEYKNAQRAFHCALAYSLIVGTAGSLLLYFGAGVLVKPNAVPVLRVFAPTIFLFGILGAVRGYFQANQSMVQTSVSQILEQIANAAVSIGAATILIRTAAAHANTTERAVRGAMGSALGTGSGVTVALLFMAAAYFRHRKSFFNRIHSDVKHAEPYARVMKSTILVITPFIASSFILNLTTTLDQMIYLNMMIDGRRLPEAAVTTVFGLFSNKAVVITNIPISVATAVSAAIIPNIATAYASGDIKETRRRSVNASRMALIISIPCAVGLMVLARPVTMLMFPQWDTLELASVLLALQAVTVIFLSVGTITNAVLQAIGRMNMFALNELFLRHYLDLRFSAVQVYGKPILSAVLMGAAAYGTYRVVFAAAGRITGEYFANFMATVPAIFVAIIVYFFLLIRMGGFTEDDILGLPKGTKLVRLLKKLHWL